MKNTRVLFALTLALMIAALAFGSSTALSNNISGTVPEVPNVGTGFCQDNKEVNTGNSSVLVISPEECKIQVTKVDTGYGATPPGLDILSSTVRVLVFDKKTPVSAIFEICFPKVPKTEAQIYQWSVDADGNGLWTGLSTYSNRNGKEYCAMAYSTGIFALLGK